MTISISSSRAAEKETEIEIETFELFCIKTNGWLRLCVELMDAKRNNNNNNSSTCFLNNLQEIPCTLNVVRVCYSSTCCK